MSVSMHRHRVVYRKANFYLYATSTTTRGSGANRRARSLARVCTSHQYDDTPEDDDDTDPAAKVFNKIIKKKKKKKKKRIIINLTMAV